MFDQLDKACAGSLVTIVYNSFRRYRTTLSWISTLPGRWPEDQVVVGLVDDDWILPNRATLVQ